jgi:S-DNA-T family DNA segregation ATPase FtsK/SpoIIIE
MYEDAVRLVLEFGKASTSLIQRRLRVGYGRAAHLIDMMERDGIVGAADGPKPREVLKRPDWITEVEDAMRLEQFSVLSMFSVFGSRGGLMPPFFICASR